MRYQYRECKIEARNELQANDSYHYRARDTDAGKRLQVAKQQHENILFSRSLYLTIQKLIHSLDIA